MGNIQAGEGYDIVILRLFMHESYQNPGFGNGRRTRDMKNMRKCRTLLAMVLCLCLVWGNGVFAWAEEGQQDPLTVEVDVSEGWEKNDH